MAAPLRAQPQPLALPLDSALARAARVHPALRVARAAVARAGAELRQARSAYYPELSASASYQRLLRNQFSAIARDQQAADPAGAADTSGGGLGAFTQVFAAPNTFTFGLQGDLTLFDAGRARASVRAADAGRRAAAVGDAAAGARLRLDVTEQYFDAALADRLVAIAESSLVQADRAYRVTALATRVGQSATYDLLRARVARDAQEPSLAQARAGRTLAQLRLRRTLALPAHTPLALTTDLEASLGPLGVVTSTADTLAVAPPAPFARPVLAAAERDGYVAGAASALRPRPEAARALAAAVAAGDTSVDRRAGVRQAREAAAAQRARLAASRAARLPSVGVSSAYQRFAYPARTRDLRSVNQFFPNWTVAVGVSAPLFTGGRLAGAVQAAQADLAQAEAQLAEARDAAALDGASAVAALEASEATYASSAGAADEAARAHAIAEVRHRAGLATPLELSDARLQLQQVASTRARAARDLLVARTRLLLLPDLPFERADAPNAPATPDAASRADGAPAPRAPAALTSSPFSPSARAPLR